MNQNIKLQLAQKANPNLNNNYPGVTNSGLVCLNHFRGYRLQIPNQIHSNHEVLDINAYPN